MEDRDLKSDLTRLMLSSLSSSSSRLCEPAAIVSPDNDRPNANESSTAVHPKSASVSRTL
jgi:hypothetical protein